MDMELYKFAVEERRRRADSSMGGLSFDKADSCRRVSLWRRHKINVGKAGNPKPPRDTTPWNSAKPERREAEPDLTNDRKRI